METLTEIREAELVRKLVEAILTAHGERFGQTPDLRMFKHVLQTTRIDKLIEDFKSRTKQISVPMLELMTLEVDRMLPGRNKETKATKKKAKQGIH